tara:strand:+ start:10112 stop:11026 length:915 start_codon:yes stop_codon:yes gene_type:complete
MKVKAIGIANKSSAGKVLDVYFPNIESNNIAIESHIPEITSHLQEIIEVDWIGSELQEAVSNPVDAYLKLHLLSNRFVLPNTINLDGLFNALPNIAWTNKGPIDLSEINKNLHLAKINNNDLYVKSVDKFPRMTDYVVPKNVRIADSSRVRLGAYLSEGTTVMHEGFVNFNAGTLGKAMIEGRISAGVIVGNNSDLGGGSSTMGTLSGGNEVKISIGENCLLGANAGIGISLGNNCIVEAGLYITSGTKVHVMDAENKSSAIIKARDISGKSNLLFMRDSISGKVIAKINKTKSSLNKELHQND